MTQEEWAPIAAFAENAWKDEFDKGREAAYLEALQHYDAGAVRQAVVRLAGRPGGAWLPSAAEIATEVAAIQRIGTWPWALEQLHVLLAAAQQEAEDREHRTGTGTGRKPIPTRDDVPAEALRKVADTHPVYGPMVLQVLDDIGIRYLALHGHVDYFARHYGRRAWAQVTLRMVNAAPVGELVA